MAFTQTQVSQLYVSVFGRASEGEGNAFWQAKEGTMASLADEMLASPASIEYFGATLDDNQAFIEFIYNNTLGKTIEEDPDGIAYWVGRLEAGDSKGQIVATLVAALVDGDFTGDADAIAAQAQFNNRVEVSNYTADNIETAEVADLDAFAGYINGVTDDAATVDAAKADVDYVETSALIAIAAEAAYAEFTISADATPGEIATAEALTLTTAEAAIAAGATQAEIDELYDSIVADNAAALTLENVIALDAANAAVVDFLAAVDTDVVDPTTVDDDEDGDATTDDTVASSADVHAAYDAAVLEYNALVGGNVETDSATTDAALYAAKLAEKTAAVTVAEAAVTDIEDEIADIDGLNDALDDLAAKTVILDAATADVADAADALSIALATYDVTNGGALGDTTLEEDGTDNAITDVLIQITDDELSLVDGVTETTNPGITAVLEASIAKEAADAALIVADADVSDADAAVGVLDPTDLAGDLAAAELAIIDDQDTDDTSDDTGAQAELNALIAAKADYDALVVVEDALTDLEDTVTTLDGLVDDITLTGATPVAATAADDVVMISNLVAGDEIVITGFSATDSLYFGDAFTFNAGALTDGDNAVVEMFITEGATDDDSLITFETAAFGSVSEGDFFSVELTGVATDEITVFDGMIIGA